MRFFAALLFSAILFTPAIAGDSSYKPWKVMVAISITPTSTYVGPLGATFSTKTECEANLNRLYIEAPEEISSEVQMMLCYVEDATEA